MRNLRKAYAIATWLVVAAVFIQFALAGLGVFAPTSFCSSVESPAGTLGCFAVHALFGDLVVFLLVLIQLILAFAARVPWGMTGRSGGLLGLFVLQGLLIIPYYDMEGPIRAVSALHVVNGILILLLAMHVAGRARDLAAEPSSLREELPSEVVSRPVGAKGG